MSLCSLLVFATSSRNHVTSEEYANVIGPSHTEVTPSPAVANHVCSKCVDALAGEHEEIEVYR